MKKPMTVAEAGALGGAVGTPAQNAARRRAGFKAGGKAGPGRALKCGSWEEAGKIVEARGRSLTCVVDGERRRIEYKGK